MSKLKALFFTGLCVAMSFSVQANEQKTYLKENAGKPGVKTTASGLQYKISQEGTGISPAASDLVTVHYHGTLIDGTVFDSSVQRGEPSSFALNQVISGWTEGLQLMKEGGKTTFYIPAELAYGDRATGKIQPGSTLIFDVELLEVKALNLPTSLAELKQFSIADMACGEAPKLPASAAGLDGIRPQAEAYTACARDYYSFTVARLKGLMAGAQAGDENYRDVTLDKIRDGKKTMSVHLDRAARFVQDFQKLAAGQ